MTTSSRRIRNERRQLNSTTAGTTPFVEIRATEEELAAAAILVSFLATIYPSRNATKITPAEVLRYE